MAKRIAVLADGTGNTVNRQRSNVLRLCQMLDTSESSGQVAIYDPGVGTTASVEELRDALSRSARLHVIEDEARQWKLKQYLKVLPGWLVGYGTEANIRQLYRALVRQYQPGDEIYLFGFSRGAFTVRALAGVIYRCGILRVDDDDLVTQALALCQDHLEGWEHDARLRAIKENAETFKRDNSHACGIRFLGVWDTVKSVGYILPKTPPHTRHNPLIRTVRHALSIGERRSFYATTTWGGLDGESRRALYLPDHRAGDAFPAEGPAQDVKEVWFPGDHSDVGGGRSPDHSAIADVTLQWMVNEACEAELRIVGERYREVIAARPLSPNVVHNEMTDGHVWPIVWGALEYCPRRDITNEPPPPKLSKLRPKSLGPRRLESAKRGGLVYVHRSAQLCCADGRWSHPPFEFVEPVDPVLAGEQQA
jgi:uncharacterized protein (DUF2235 family)